jgi:cation-transporting ATPase E
VDATGLTGPQVQERVGRGQVNRVAERTSRSIGSIVRANVLTRFNAILSILLATILLVGSINDALFGGVLVANTLIGVIQELRAKWVLDRLAILNAPTARVLRDGQIQEIPVAAVVLDDVLELRPGDQVVADGTVLTAAELELDEALISGEAAPVVKAPGDPVLSGSFVVAGIGQFRAVGVGPTAYAQQLASAARQFKPAHSELRSGINRILNYSFWAIAVAAPLLFWSQMQAQGSLVPEALRSTVAGMVPMVPEGLVLLTSVTLAVAVTRLSRRRALIQELPAVETLARVTTLCFDKTGTLTTGKAEIDSVEALDPSGDVEAALGALAAADPTPNATVLAIASRYPAPAGWTATHVAAFSSARKWSGAEFGTHGDWLLGAPDILLDATAHSELLAQIAVHAAAGRRVTLLARTAGLPDHGMPPNIQPAALVIMAEEVRPDAKDTVAFFLSQGIALKVISGDHPQTAGAVARSVGVPGADAPADAHTLPVGDKALTAFMTSASVFGRASPAGKRVMIAALQRQGQVVAMTGDGVNDVLALKQADIGIAMGQGSGAARAIAQLTLLDGEFASLPHVLAEGRRVIGNVERLAILFVTKTVYATALAGVVSATGLIYPFLPRHLTLTGTLTIGIPAFFLSLAANAARARSGFVGRVVRIATPGGLIAAAATLAASFTAMSEFGATIEEGRTVASIVLFSIGLTILADLSRPLTRLRVLLITSMIAAFSAMLVIPLGQDFFALVSLSPRLWLLTALIAAPSAAIALVCVRRNGP